MKIQRPASAGQRSRWDCQVDVEPAPEGAGLTVEIESTVGTLFDAVQRAALEEHLKALEVTEGRIRVIDDGALDYVLRARLECALVRAAGEE